MTAKTYRAVIYESMEVIADQTCVRFVPRNGEKNYIQFIRGDGYTQQLDHIILLAVL